MIAPHTPSESQAARGHYRDRSELEKVRSKIEAKKAEIVRLQAEVVDLRTVEKYHMEELGMPIPVAHGVAASGALKLKPFIAAILRETAGAPMSAAQIAKGINSSTIRCSAVADTGSVTVALNEGEWRAAESIVKEHVVGTKNRRRYRVLGAPVHATA